jgi:hypothetical protein
MDDFINAVVIISFGKERLTVDQRRGNVRQLMASMNSDCAICLEPVICGVSQVADLPCCHAFHAICLGDWFRHGDTCPVCRRKC